MITKKFVIKNEHGLHARPASLFCSMASRFKSDIKVKRNGKNMEANGKSVISILMLEIYPGSMIEISANGEDEEVALDAITALINSNFE